MKFGRGRERESLDVRRVLSVNRLDLRQQLETAVLHVRAHADAMRFRVATPDPHGLLGLARHGKAGEVPSRSKEVVERLRDHEERERALVVKLLSKR